MSDCVICDQPPCICRCQLDAPERWYGVLSGLAAAQLHAKRISALKAARSPYAASRLQRNASSDRTLLALRAMGPGHAAP